MAESSADRPNPMGHDHHGDSSDDIGVEDIRVNDTSVDDEDDVRPPEVIFPPWFVPVLLTCILGPMAIAVVTALGRWWPSTVAVRIFGDGLFGATSLRWQIVWTFVLIGLAELAVLVPLAIVATGIRRLRVRERERPPT